MAACKLPGKNADTPQASPASPVAATECTLADDLLLEIVARSDTRTLIRCAAACKLLRRDILGQSFIDRVTQQGGIVPPRILAHLNIHDAVEKDNDPPLPPRSLVHPATPAAVSFVDDHLSPYLSRFTGDLLGDHYYVVTSRGSLVLLCGQHVSDDEIPNLCVYDPITGQRTFVPYPSGVYPNRGMDNCVLLSAADEIGCSFQLFAPYLDTKLDGSYTGTIKVQTATSTSGTWAAALSIHDCTGHGFNLRRGQAAIVLHGGVIHWMVRHPGEVVTYNIRTMGPGRIKLPAPAIDFKGSLHLGSYYSHDGQELLRLFGAHRLKISVWHQLPGGGWASEATVMDVEEKLRSLDPDIAPGCSVRVEFKCSGEGSDVVLLHVHKCSAAFPTSRRTLLVLLDLETKEMRVQQCSTSSSVLLEIDLRSQLQAMKIFP